MPRPDLTQVPEWYHVYINQVKENDLLLAIEDQTRSFLKFIKQIPEEKRNYRYAKGKWTIKEVLQHIVDAERIFAYRALCIARGEKASLPSFDENSYADNAKTSKREWNDLVNEFVACRTANKFLFASFDKKQMNARGISNNNPIDVLAIGFIIVGHINHHVSVMKERYFN